MTIKIVVDMNLSPEWVPVLIREGWESVHWSTVGSQRAPDNEIMAWAVAHRHIVFTHDLDFGATLALTRATGPSVLQLRGQRVLPEDVASLVVAAIRRYEREVTAGALVVIEEGRSRVRVLPL
jgi:predicted nuclease of predicted toxin-antitoxin system